MSKSHAVPGNIGAFTVAVGNFDRSEVRDIRSLVLECNIYEDIFAGAMTGNLTVLDGQALRSLLPLVGDETVVVRLAAGGRDTAEVQVAMQLYKLDNHIPVKDRLVLYNMHLGSASMMYDLTNIVTGAYGPASADTIVSSIFNTYIKSIAKTKTLTTEPCVGTHRFLFPRMSPMRAIGLTTSEAVSLNFPGSMMTFFETVDGYHFRSLASMFQQKPVETFYWTTQNIKEDPASNATLKEHAIHKHQIMITHSQRTHTDTLTGLMAGQFGFTHQFLDPVMKVYDQHRYSYATAFSRDRHVGSTAGGTYPIIDAGSPLLKTPEHAHSRYHTTVLPPSRYMQARLAETAQTVYPRKRTEHLAELSATFMQLHNTSTILVAVPGHSGLRAGQIVKLMLPEMTGHTHDGKSESRLTSGNYLIVSLNHRYTDTHYTTIIECMRDSYTKPVKNIPGGGSGGRVAVTTRPSDGDAS
jgi:hypothetical protein